MLSRFRAQNPRPAPSSPISRIDAEAATSFSAALLLLEAVGTTTPWKWENIVAYAVWTAQTRMRCALDDRCEANHPEDTQRRPNETPLSKRPPRVAGKAFR